MRTAALTRDKYNFILNKHLHSVHSPSGREAQSSAVLRTSKLPQGPRSSSASSASSCPCSCCTLRGSAASSLRRLRSTIRPRARRSSLSNRTVRESPSSRSRSLSLNEMVARRPSSGGERQAMLGHAPGAMSTPWNGGRGTHLGCARPHLLGATQLVGAPGRNLERRRYRWT